MVGKRYGDTLVEYVLGPDFDTSDGTPVVEDASGPDFDTSDGTPVVEDASGTDFDTSAGTPVVEDTSYGTVVVEDDSGADSTDGTTVVEYSTSGGLRTVVDGKSTEVISESDKKASECISYSSVVEIGI